MLSGAMPCSPRSSPRRSSRSMRRPQHVFPAMTVRATGSRRPRTACKPSESPVPCLTGHLLASPRQQQKTKIAPLTGACPGTFCTSGDRPRDPIRDPPPHRVLDPHRARAAAITTPPQSGDCAAEGGARRTLAACATARLRSPASVRRRDRPRLPDATLAIAPGRNAGASSPGIPGAVIVKTTVRFCRAIRRMAPVIQGSSRPERHLELRRQGRCVRIR